MNRLIRESAAVLRRAQRRMKRLATGQGVDPEFAGFANSEALGVSGGLGFQEELLDLQGINFTGRSDRASADRALGHESPASTPARSELRGLRLEQVAHDLDNLLIVIANRAELAQADQACDGLCTDSLRAIYSAAQQALDLSMLLRVADNRSVVRKEPIDLSKVVLDAVNHARSWLPGDIALVEDVPMHPGVCVLGNATQLQRLIRNVLSNATHALSAGGRIVISLEQVREGDGRSLTTGKESLAERTPQALLQITDNGSGMDAKTCDRVFEPGFSKREGGEGRGLGMTIVEEIVRDHGGAITLESTPERGTRVCVSFPVVRSEGTGSGQ